MSQIRPYFGFLSIRNIAGVVLMSSLICAVVLLRGINGQMALYCGSVFDEFSSCMIYVGGLSSDEPLKECCESVETLNAIAIKNEGGPQVICECIENLSYWTNVSFNATRIQQLPTKCQLHLSFPISNSMDCFKVH